MRPPERWGREAWGSDAARKRRGNDRDRRRRRRGLVHDEILRVPLLQGFQSFFFFILVVDIGRQSTVQTRSDGQGSRIVNVGPVLTADRYGLIVWVGSALNSEQKLLFDHIFSASNKCSIKFKELVFIEAYAYLAKCRATIKM